MFTRLLHGLVAQPRVYDFVQWAVGAKYIRRRLANHIAPFRASNFVLDIGGGTGSARALWSSQTRYICLDIDPLKLTGYRAKNPGAPAIQGDATDIPIKSGSIDAIVCTSVTHHLTDPLLEKMLAESARILKPAGRLILMDAYWAPRRLPGRLLWRFDRGSFPRPLKQLQSVIARSFHLEQWDEFAILHRYIIAVGKPAVPNLPLKD